MNKISRRHFLATTGAITGAALLDPIAKATEATVNTHAPAAKKLRIALIGTGGRGTSMWGRDLVKNYSDYMEFVGLCDKNEGRL